MFRLLEGKKECLAKFAGKSQLVPTVDMFWDVVRKRGASPYNDISWWMNRSFEEFKDYVDGFDDGMMKEAVLGFADSLKGELARQKDAPGQMTFGFDKDYLDNPRNLERRRK